MITSGNNSDGKRLESITLKSKRYNVISLHCLDEISKVVKNDMSKRFILREMKRVKS